MSLHAGGGYTLDITNLAQTWADGLAHTGLKLNVTDTSSTAASLLMDLQVGGSSQLKVTKSGTLNLGNGSVLISAPGNIGLALGNDLFTIKIGASSDSVISRVAAGVFKVANGSGSAGVIVTAPTTVASLPAAATAGAGARAFVTDATATTFMSTVTGGGANKVPVVSDGTSWLIG